MENRIIKGTCREKNYTRLIRQKMFQQFGKDEEIKKKKFKEELKESQMEISEKTTKKNSNKCNRKLKGTILNYALQALTFLNV